MFLPSHHSVTCFSPGPYHSLIPNSFHSHPWDHVLLKKIPPISGDLGTFIYKFPLDDCELQHQWWTSPTLTSLTGSDFLISSGHGPCPDQLSTLVATPRNSSPETSPPRISSTWPQPPAPPPSPKEGSRGSEQSTHHDVSSPPASPRPFPSSPSLGRPRTH